MGWSRCRGVMAMRGIARSGRRGRPLVVGLAVVIVGGTVGIARSAAAADDGGASDAPILSTWEVQTLNGFNNNPFSPNFGRAGTNYLRIGSPRYVDGRSQMVTGPNARLVSNRIFNDINVNVFSVRGVTQWRNVWGQFLDHSFGLRDDAGTTANIPFTSTDPLESFRNDLGVIPFTRTAAAPGTGVTNNRQQVNTVSSFIDAWAVYGGSDTRLDWLRGGTVDGNPGKNGGTTVI